MFKFWEKSKELRIEMRKIIYLSRDLEEKDYLTDPYRMEI